MKKGNNISSTPIDIVYLWCDGSDPSFQQRKQQYMPYNLAEEHGGKCRHSNNDELKYALRSMEKHAPWIHHVYIITDNQIPSWLNLSNSKVSIVDLTEILPPEVLPMFNSEAIETSIHKIKSLSEFFLYSNDDMFWGADITPDFFFTSEGYPIIRGDREVIFENYFSHVLPMLNTFQGSFSVWKKLGKTLLFCPHHNVDAYRKSFYEDAEQLFAQEQKFVLRQRFRNKNVQFRMLVHSLNYAKGRGVFKQVDWLQLSWRNQLKRLFPAFMDVTDSYHCEINNLTYLSSKIIKLGKFRLFCLNDNPNVLDNSRFSLKFFLEELFPEPSSFEKL